MSTTIKLLVSISLGSEIIRLLNLNILSAYNLILVF